MATARMRWTHPAGLLYPWTDPLSPRASRWAFAAGLDFFSLLFIISWLYAYTWGRTGPTGALVLPPLTSAGILVLAIGSCLLALLVHWMARALLAQASKWEFAWRFPSLARELARRGAAQALFDSLPVTTLLAEHRKNLSALGAEDHAGLLDATAGASPGGSPVPPHAPLALPLADAGEEEALWTGWVPPPPACVRYCSPLLRCLGRHPAQKAEFLAAARALAEKAHGSALLGAAPFPPSPSAASAFAPAPRPAKSSLARKGSSAKVAPAPHASASSNLDQLQTQLYRRAWSSSVEGAASAAAARGYRLLDLEPLRILVSGPLLRAAQGVDAAALATALFFTRVFHLCVRAWGLAVAACRKWVPPRPTRAQRDAILALMGPQALQNALDKCEPGGAGHAAVAAAAHKEQVSGGTKPRVRRAVREDGEDGAGEGQLPPEANGAAEEGEGEEEEGVAEQGEGAEDAEMEAEGAQAQAAVEALDEDEEAEQAQAQQAHEQAERLRRLGDASTPHEAEATAWVRANLEARRADAMWYESVAGTLWLPRGCFASSGLIAAIFIVYMLWCACYFLLFGIMVGPAITGFTLTAYVLSIFLGWAVVRPLTAACTPVYHAVIFPRYLAPWVAWVPLLGAWSGAIAAMRLEACSGALAVEAGSWVASREAGEAQEGEEGMAAEGENDNEEEEGLEGGSKPARARASLPPGAAAALLYSTGCGLDRTLRSALFSASAAASASRMPLRHVPGVAIAMAHPSQFHALALLWSLLPKAVQAGPAPPPPPSEASTYALLHLRLRLAVSQALYTSTTAVELKRKLEEAVAAKEQQALNEAQQAAAAAEKAARRAQAEAQAKEVAAAAGAAAAAAAELDKEGVEKEAAAAAAAAAAQRNEEEGVEGSAQDEPPISAYSLQSGMASIAAARKLLAKTTRSLNSVGSIESPWSTSASEREGRGSLHADALDAAASAASTARLTTGAGRRVSTGSASPMAAVAVGSMLRRSRARRETGSSSAFTEPRNSPTHSYAGDAAGAEYSAPSPDVARQREIAGLLAKLQELDAAAAQGGGGVEGEGGLGVSPPSGGRVQHLGLSQTSVPAYLSPPPSAPRTTHAVSIAAAAIRRMHGSQILGAGVRPMAHPLSLAGMPSASPPRHFAPLHPAQRSSMPGAAHSALPTGGEEEEEFGEEFEDFGVPPPQGAAFQQPPRFRPALPPLGLQMQPRALVRAGSGYPLPTNPPPFLGLPPRGARPFMPRGPHFAPPRPANQEGGGSSF